VPVSDCTAGEFEASLVKDRDAEAAPLDCGVNVTVNVEASPSGIVTGNEIPESVNSPLLLLAEVTVTDVPLAVRLPPRAELDPTATLPKARVVGETARVPATDPVPESAMASGELDAVETTDKLPLAAPLAVGVNVAVKVTLSFVVRSRGKVRPVIEKPAPLNVACEIVIVDPLLLVRVSERLELWPGWTLPKESADGDATRVGSPEPPAPTLWQPVSSASPAPIRSELIKQRLDRKTRNAPTPLSCAYVLYETRIPRRTYFGTFSLFNLGRVIEITAGPFGQSPRPWTNGIRCGIRHLGWIHNGE